MDSGILRDLLTSGDYGDAPGQSALYVALWGFVVSTPSAPPGVVVARVSHGALARALGRRRANVGRDLGALARRGWIAPKARTKRQGEYILATRGEGGGLQRGSGQAPPTGCCPLCHHPEDPQAQGASTTPREVPSQLPSCLSSCLPSSPEPHTDETPENTGDGLPSPLPSSLPSSLPSEAGEAGGPETDSPLSPRASAQACAPAQAPVPAPLGAPARLESPQRGLGQAVGRRPAPRQGGLTPSPYPSPGGDSLPPPFGGRTFISPTRSRAMTVPGNFSFGAKGGVSGKNPGKHDPFGESPEDPEGPLDLEVHAVGTVPAASQTPDPEPKPPGGAPPPFPATSTPEPVEASGGPSDASVATHPLATPARRPEGAAPWHGIGRVKPPGYTPPRSPFADTSRSTRPQARPSTPSSSTPGYAPRSPSPSPSPSGGKPLGLGQSIHPHWVALFAQEFPGATPEVWGPREFRILDDLAARYGERDARLLAFLFLKAWKSRWAKDWFWGKEPIPTVGLLFLKHGSLIAHVKDAWVAYDLAEKVMPYFRKHRLFEDSDLALVYSKAARLLADVGYGADDGGMLPLPAEWGGPSPSGSQG